MGLALVIETNACNLTSVWVAMWVMGIQVNAMDMGQGLSYGSGFELF